MIKTRILLADDLPAMRDKVASLLGRTYEIVGSVTDGQAAIDAAVEQNPDVILMDISMPGIDGIEAAGRLIRMHTDAKIIFLTVHEDPEFLKAALATGAAGYVVMSRIATDLIPAIRAAVAQHRFVSRVRSQTS